MNFATASDDAPPVVDWGLLLTETPVASNSYYSPPGRQLGNRKVMRCAANGRQALGLANTTAGRRPERLGTYWARGPVRFSNTALELHKHWRDRLRTTENDLEAAAARLAAMEHQEVERAAAEILVDSTDIWRAEPDMTQFYDDEFKRITASKVSEAAKILAAAKPHLAKPAGADSTAAHRAADRGLASRCCARGCRETGADMEPGAARHRRLDWS